MIMKELLRTHDPILLSWAQTILKDYDIETIVFDEHTGIIQGSIGAIEKRLMVHNLDHHRAEKILQNAQNEHNIT